MYSIIKIGIEVFDVLQDKVWVFLIVFDKSNQENVCFLNNLKVSALFTRCICLFELFELDDLDRHVVTT